MRKLRLRAALLAVALVLSSAAASNAAQHSAQRDYQRLSGEWQLTSAIVNGRPLRQAQVTRTVLITDMNTFRFPQAKAAATHPAGRFTVYPDRNPKQVDSIAIGGKNAGQLTRGIYQIIDDDHKRACWGPPGGPRPPSFDSPPGSQIICQTWKKIGPVPHPRPSGQPS
jgi:uncharacterized protein (TIGR03067 family)